MGTNTDNQGEPNAGERDAAALITQLRDPDWTVSQNAAKLLVQLGEPAVLPLVGELHYHESEVRRRAVHALGQIGNHAAVEPLIRLLDEDEDKLVLWCVALALGKFADSSAVPSLRSALEDEDSNVGTAAASALARIGRPAVVPLINALSHPEYRVRRSAAAALSTIADERSIDPLIVALDDMDEWVRYSAAEGLGAIGGDRVIYPLIGALDDEDADVRATAAVALGELADPRALPALEGLKDDTEFTWEDQSVAEVASEAIARIQERAPGRRTR